MKRRTPPEGMRHLRLLLSEAEGYRKIACKDCNPDLTLHISVAADGDRSITTDVYHVDTCPRMLDILRKRAARGAES